MNKNHHRIRLNFFQEVFQIFNIAVCCFSSYGNKEWTLDPRDWIIKIQTIIKSMVFLARSSVNEITAFLSEVLK